ncbi:hypothetical protein HY493_05455 [Candidatus Woesearchaeota archaeon]|nr:hypothetical protein [Candidatus Woesearchaeota archaeon]
MSLESYARESPLPRSLSEGQLKAGIDKCRAALGDIERAPLRIQHGLLEENGLALNRQCKFNPTAAIAYSIMTGYHAELVEFNWKEFESLEGQHADTKLFDLHYFAGSNDVKRCELHKFKPEGFHAKATHHFQTSYGLWAVIGAAHQHIAYRHARFAHVCQVLQQLTGQQLIANVHMHVQAARDLLTPDHSDLGQVLNTIEEMSEWLSRQPGLQQDAATIISYADPWLEWIQNRCDYDKHMSIIGRIHDQAAKKL